MTNQIGVGQTVQLDCRAIPILFVIWGIGNCSRCLNGRNDNETETEDKDLKNYKVSIQTMWNNKRDRQKSAKLWKCLQKKTCSINVTKSNNFTCLCASKLCVKIKCSDQKERTQMKISCKIERAKDHGDCLASTVIEELNDQHINRENTCTRFGEQFNVNNTQLAVINKPDIETNATLNFKFEHNGMKMNDLQDALRDVVQNYSDCEVYSVIVTSPDSFIYLCVIGISKTHCIISKCKEGNLQNNETNRRNIQDIKYSIQNIWKRWKEKIVLVFSGVLIFGGIVGFLMGMKFTRKRQMKMNKAGEIPNPRHTFNSELYAEISESKGEEQNITMKVELENIFTGRSSSNAMVSTCNSIHSIDNAYSNVYNVLQPNYGQRRGSYPVAGVDTKRVYTKYCSLEKMNGPH